MNYLRKVLTSSHMRKIKIAAIGGGIPFFIGVISLLLLMLHAFTDANTIQILKIISLECVFGALIFLLVITNIVIGAVVDYIIDNQTSP